MDYVKISGFRFLVLAIRIRTEDHVHLQHKSYCYAIKASVGLADLDVFIVLPPTSRHNAIHLICSHIFVIIDSQLMTMMTMLALSMF